MRNNEEKIMCKNSLLWREKNFLPNYNEVRNLREGENKNNHLKKPSPVLSDTLPQGRENINILSKKPAITLAEILIVVVIVAIIGCVLIAMPRKNVSTTDRAKYYIAYSTLQRLLSEQLADNGKIALNVSSVTAENCTLKEDDKEKANCENVVEKFNKSSTFGDMVEKWLNTAEVNATNAKLTNGMKLYWTSVNSGKTKDKTNNNITTEKVVCVDIDGDNEGRNIEGKDKHCFLLYRKKETTGEGESEVTTYNDIRIKPVKTDDESPYNSDDNIVPASNDTWLTFKVFKIKDNGKMDIKVLDKDYKIAYDYYDDNSKCNDSENCFIEPIPPLK